jgi:hypothetical protein
MKAKIIYDFIEKYPKFLTSKLRKYFFECEFCNILPTRLGYYPATILGNYLYYYDITQDLSSLVDTWISENNLSHLKEYKKYNTNIL